MEQSQMSYDGLSEMYQQIINQTAAVAQDFETLLKEVKEDGQSERNGYTQRVFTVFRERANSELLSIAFFGAFSSGKSFLISGLDNRLDWFEYRGSATATVTDQYASLLPSSPRQTSNCPVAVEPLPKGEGNEDQFWVFFEDKQSWEERFPALEPIIQAYVTDLPNAQARRMPRDRNRNVVKARLRIASACMNARLYDLPGIGSIGNNYDDVVREYVRQADCLVYVAWAIRPLEEKELALLRYVYDHHKATGKPVFFVLTQLDRNQDYDTSSGKVGWQDVLDANNEFLERYFHTDSGKPDRGFIGEGFIPVSAALEAKSRGLSLIDPPKSTMLQVHSKMSDLRQRFEEYLHTTSGPMHLAELVAELQRLLSRLGQDISARSAAESTPIESARASIIALKREKSVLQQGKQELEGALASLGRAAIRRAFSGSDPDDLAQLIVERLKTRIETEDVLKDDVVHRLETDKATIVREWIGRDRDALVVKWDGAWNSFVEQSTGLVIKLLDTALEAHDQAMKEADNADEREKADIAKVRVEDRLRATFDSASEKTLRETLEVLSTAWQTWSLIAGIGASGVVSAAALAPMALIGPIGWALIATAAIGAGFGKWKLTERLKERRKVLVQEIPTYSQKVVLAYQQQAQQFLEMHNGHLVEILDQEITRLSDSISTLEQRLLTGEYTDRERRLGTLLRLSNQTKEIEKHIEHFLGVATALRPQSIAGSFKNSR